MINTDNQALEQIASKQAEVDRLRTDASTLRAEKEQWQVSYQSRTTMGYS
jgi:FtsZ-binding cell division protein ZapB